MNVLIVGGNGGIGAALLGLASADPRVDRLLATHRGPAPVCTGGDQPRWLRLDLLEPRSIECAVRDIASEVEHLDLVIFAAGYLHGDHGQPEKSLRALDGDTMQAVMQINALGPLCLFAGLEPLLKKSAGPKIGFLSAQVGSIEDNGLGGWYSYRAAKAALNQGVKTASIELSRWKNDPVVLAIHPGTTATALSEPFLGRRKDSVQTAQASAEKIWRLLDEVRSEQSGTFLKNDGTRLPW